MEPEEFFHAINRKRLKHAQRMMRDLELAYPLEVDCVYRAYHSSYKIFLAQDIILKYLRVILALVGRDKARNPVEAAREAGFDRRFVKLISDAVGIKPHMGRIGVAEWRKLFSALYHVKVCADACLRFVEELLSGRPLPRVLDSHHALAIYIFGITEVRYLSDVEVALMMSKSPSLRRLYKENVARVIETVRKLVKAATEKRVLSWRECVICRRLGIVSPSDSVVGRVVIGDKDRRVRIIVYAGVDVADEARRALRSAGFTPSSDGVLIKFIKRGNPEAVAERIAKRLPEGAYAVLWGVLSAPYPQKAT